MNFVPGWFRVGSNLAVCSFAASFLHFSFILVFENSRIYFFSSTTINFSVIYQQLGVLFLCFFATGQKLSVPDEEEEDGETREVRDEANEMLK